MRVLATVTAALFLALTTTLSAQPIQLEARELQGGDHFTLTGSATETLLTLEVRIQDGWHMYGRPTGGGVPVNLEILEGSNFAAAGKQTVPMDEKGELKGVVKITLPLKRTSPGGALHVRFSYMVCDALMCLPPSEVMQSGSTAMNGGHPPAMRWSIRDAIDISVKLRASMPSPVPA